jgi:D-alanyl-D-alanine carboxypeptidase
MAKRRKKSTERIIRYDRIAIVALIVLIVAIAIYLISDNMKSKYEKDDYNMGAITTVPEDKEGAMTSNIGSDIVTSGAVLPEITTINSSVPTSTAPTTTTKKANPPAQTQAPTITPTANYPAPAIDPKLQANGNYVNGILIANKSYPLPEDYSPGEQKISRAAFDAMQVAAKADGIKLWIKSGYRSYSYQKQLYDNYVNRDGKEKADTYSARPGHSEHQTGLAFDINTASSSDNFQNTQEGKWLAKNAHKFGFILRYQEGKMDITGYKYEPWHFRYVGSDVAKTVFDSGKTLEEYLGITSVYAS